MNISRFFRRLYLPLLLTCVLAGSAGAETAGAPGPFAILDPLWDLEKIVIIYGAGGGGTIIGGGLADTAEIVFGLPLGHPVDPGFDNVMDNLPKVHEAGLPYLIKTRDRVVRVVDAVGDAAHAVGDGADALSDWLRNMLSSAVYVAGDANTDGEVDFADYLIVSANYGMQTAPSDSPTAAWEAGDFDQDGIVGFSDFLLLSQTF